ncbi:toll/interleukin-1 receptor domain-containing protein [Lentzea aerocolonigenes]|uniref:toll/interleukin-1 receptor domain-containing protein n=1 Tax=Lentzea aerocolonigenes TaxID=68170 RepID=UPI000AD37479|nr:toll/interleukin-1 receptor domain-containing protein [Lentzea aerocolonigenes]MCP2244147.1 TIR domain-containing protein [Lentzea aerocolonigenes]
MAASSDEARTRVFLSYSRKDSDFVIRLAAELDARGYLVDFDQSSRDPNNVITGISAEDLWWIRLQEMIALADVVLFVVSPDSIRSAICDEEIAFAQNLKKRVIPVLCREIDFAKAPPRLSALNIKVKFAGGDAVVSADQLALLAAAVDQDVVWLRGGTRLLAAAQRWDAGGRAEDALLRGVEHRDAEEWAVRRPGSAPELPELVLEFLSASRAAEAKRKTIGELEKARYLELVGVMRPFLEEELKIREAMPVSSHHGIAEEDRVEIAMLRGLLHLDNKWHPEPPRHLASTGAVDGYAEMFRFPCCGQIVKEFRNNSRELASQFRPGGCVPVPEEIQYQYNESSNPFHSILIRRYRSLSAGQDDA